MKPLKVALLTFAVIMCLGVRPVLAKQSVQRIVFKFEDKTREAYLFVPVQQGPLPVLVLLHGSGRNGRVMIDEWKDLASREGIILAAPDALHDMEWSLRSDPPEFLHEVVNQSRAFHAVDAGRIYLFGHSAGAQFALIIALVDSNYYAATAIHAGTLPGAMMPALSLPRRHMPIAIWTGDLDPYFPVEDVRETKRVMDANGFDIRLSVIALHDHNYYAISSTVNPRAWKFLSQFCLSC